MRWLICCALGLAACDGTGFSDGTRSPCASGGQILGCEEEITTPDDACWKLVQCGVIPVDTDNPDTPETDPQDPRYWGGCVEVIEDADDNVQELMIECIAASSCDALAIHDYPYDWPDCLEVEGRP